MTSDTWNREMWRLIDVLDEAGVPHDQYEEAVRVVVKGTDFLRDLEEREEQEMERQRRLDNVARDREVW